MSKKLEGKVAVVTGASKGIGAAIAQHLAAEGAQVVVNYASSKEGADKTVAAITAKGGKAIAVKGDVAKAADVAHLFAETRKAYGNLDILVNNAGIYQFSSLEEVTEELFHKQFNTNVLGLLLATREAVKLFGDKGGSVINISSAVTALTPPNTVIYTATKGAVVMFTKGLCADLAPHGIQANAIAPGYFATELTRALVADPVFSEWVVGRTPARRWGDTRDLIGATVFLASSASDFVNGQTIYVDGGMTAVV